MHAWQSAQNGGVVEKRPLSLYLVETLQLQQLVVIWIHFDSHTIFVFLIRGLWLS